MLKEKTSKCRRGLDVRMAEGLSTEHTSDTTVIVIILLYAYNCIIFENIFS